MTIDKKDPSRLLPDRHPQADFFVCDIFDAAPKSDTASMEYPLFTLSTKPDFSVKEFSSGDKWIKLSPSPAGLATVHDRDVLIYLISQCMAALNGGRKIERRMRFQAQDMLIATNRKTSGEGYKLLRAALKRLQGTQIETNITTGGKEVWKVFSFIKEAEIVRKTRDGRMQEIEIELSDWVFNAIREKEGDILTISRDYFRLRKPLERRLYELARKCCGTSNQEWRFTLKTLHERTGSQSTPREFKRLISSIVDDGDHIPDYRFELRDETLYIFPKGAFSEQFSPPPPRTEDIENIRLDPETYEKARQHARGWDIHAIEADWRAMLSSKQEGAPKKPDGSFINFVKWYAATKGSVSRPGF